MPAAPPTDQALIVAANRGDAEAFEALYARHRDWVAGLAERFCRCPEDALDAMQETFAYLFGKFPGFELRCQLRTFLYPVIKNLCLNLIARRRRTVPLAEGQAEAISAPEPPASADGVEALLAGLDADEREILRLRFVDELDLAGIGQVLAIPLGTVKSRLHRALERLRACHC